MGKLKLLYRYLVYLIRSTNAHGVHSPFVYDLITEVIYVDKEYYSFAKIRSIRKKLLENNAELVIQDYGAGSVHSSSSKKRISDIARYSSKPDKYGKLLFRLVNKIRPDTILELGTSLGLSGIYLASARKQAQFITLEGSREIAQLARENFFEMKLANVELQQGKFEEKLQGALQKLQKLRFVFIDGNHTKIATLTYFYECLKFSDTESVFVFDDIHWSKGMEEAWDEIKNHPKVSVTIDLFYLGIVFFRGEQEKENFVIRY